ncbi:MAG: type II toxin-antitoxin system PemK/MazF family toxin [Candidatus Dormibacteraeota bacterium]|nr:type II toxin-antitoxin system PemK/MazF family toxin [Candidatus Dormibacteraeota bacterium]MBO0705313.1 type II toxin-antitoxin system PemK/MazF family toxin [Candidatus Dormibacteraeota bacterium]MBO0760241.1 type II toxin-antitoxin system PemK/MazF family toxin [Candidatus Dormibacteraeota bacterium]
MTPEISPWEVWWADFDPQVGPEQAGLRPAIVVGTPLACQLPNQLAFVVPCTTTDRRLPFHPAVASLGQPSFAMCDQLKSISRQRLARRHRARLQPAEIDAIKFVLRQMIDTR